MARKLGVSPHPSAVQTVQVTIDALVLPEVMPFWRTVLGYEDRDPGGEDLIDPRGRGALFWFQKMDAPRPQRTESTSTSGCRLVTDKYAPTWWTLADTEGNEADVCTWMRPA